MAYFFISCFADEIAADIATQIRVMKEQGIRYVEMRDVDGISVLKHDLNSVREIKKKLDAAGIRLSAIGSYIGKQPITDEFTHLEELKYCAEIAGILEVSNIRMFSFFIPAGEAAAFRDVVMERLSQLLEVAKGAKLLLLHENGGGVYGDTAERCLDIVKTMNSPELKLIFDPGNFIQCGVEPYPYAWELLKDYVVYIHIKDAIKGTGASMPAGSGDGRIADLLWDLDKRDTEVFLSIEPHLTDFYGFDALEPSLKTLPAGNNIEKFTLAHTALKQLLATIQ